MRFLIAVPWILFAATLTGQAIVVDPSGGGHHTDLQAALDAAPPGAVIRVVGGTYGPLLITRSVTILAQPTATITQPLYGSGSQPPAIRLLGNGTQYLTLANVRITNPADGGTGWNSCGAALESTGFARVMVQDSTLRGAHWTVLSGSAYGARGIAVTGPATVLLERCVVQGSKSDVDADHIWVLDGVPGIDAPQAAVVALDSQVTGGSCGPSTWVFYAPSAAPCPCSGPGISGTGGAGIRATSVITAGSTIAGGTGSQVRWQGQPWGSQPNGLAFATGTLVAMPTTVVQSTPLRIGTNQLLAFAPTTVPSVLVIGSPLTPPATVYGVSLVFLDPTQPLTAVFLAPGATSHAVAVPNATAPLGFEIAEQRFDLTASGITASNPIVGAILP